MVKLTLPFIEPAQARWLYPIGSIYRTGAVVAFGSDWSVSSANPLEEMEVAITRMGPHGETKEPFIPERIDLPVARLHDQRRLRQLPGRQDRVDREREVADLIVLDHNLFTIKPEAISDAKVLLTLMGGVPVYGDPGSIGGSGR